MLKKFRKLSMASFTGCKAFLAFTNILSEKFYDHSNIFLGQAKLHFFGYISDFFSIVRFQSLAPWRSYTKLLLYFCDINLSVHLA